eukprot:CAMPEP_0178946790 /NCGR_PEP_ID=MMETSP0789-20121207/4479_1 /TAXON_ID=3005 /ORGANISM="Rhizosolenia setigera, Strain CCMP 1694" /LENGTH=281 /DNA_ID=CAMNT_0020626817 /DNA_START=83 /DNA_END=931 /DNA_ORIENTATION=+
MATTVDGTGDKATQEKTKQQATTKTYFEKLNADVIKLTSQDTDLFAGAIENNNDQERELQQVSSFETIDDDDIDIYFCAGCKNYIGNCAICQDLKDTGNIIDTGNSSDTNDTLYNDTEVEVNCEECEEFVDECAVCGEYPDDGYNYTECNATEPYLIGNGECNYEYFFGCNFDGGDCDFMDYFKELKMSPVIMLLGFVILLGFCGFAITTVSLVFVASIPALLPSCVIIPIAVVLTGVLTLPAAVLGSVLASVFVYLCSCLIPLSYDARFSYCILDSMFDF